MPLKNGNTVALERRMDLASLFCMIGRHGPAVALAVIAMVSVLAGFILYRTVRGKRRKATAGAEDGGGRSPEAERDASLIQPERESLEESRSSVEESTDVSDEGSSDVKEDADVIPSDLTVRHRHAAAEKKPPPPCPPRRDLPPDNRPNASVVQEWYKVAETYAPEANPSLQSDTHTAAEVDVEDNADCHQGFTDDTIKDVEEGRDNDSCLKAELIYNESHEEEEEEEEEEEVLQAEYQEDENVTADVDVSDEKTSHVEEKLQCVLNSPVEFEQNPHVSENRDDYRLRENEITPETLSTESNLEEPTSPIKDVPVIYICDSKDAEVEEENCYQDSANSSNSDNNDQLSPEKETQNEDEKAEEESLNDQLIAEQAEIRDSASEPETTPSSSQQGQCDAVTDEVTLSFQDSDGHDGRGLSGEVIKGDINEDHLNNLTHVKSADPQQQQLQIDQTNALTCNQEDCVKGEIVTLCGEKNDISGVILDSAPPCLDKPVEPETTDNCDDDVCRITSDAKAQISGIVDFPDLPSDYQQQESEMTNDEIAPTLAKDTDPNTPGPDLLSLTEEIQSENGTVVALAEESVDRPASSCCYEDHCLGNNVTFDQPGVNSTSDAAACEEVKFITPMTPIERSHSDLLSSAEEKQIDQMQNEVNLPVVNTFEQSKLVLSFSGLCVESGISSMTVSPDLQDAGNEFDTTPEYVVLPVITLNSEEQAEAPNSLFADDAALYVKNEETADVAFESCPTHLVQEAYTEPTTWTSDESFVANEEMFGENSENSTVASLAEKSIDRLVSSWYENQQRDSLEKNDTLDKTKGSSASDVPVCDEARFTTEIPHPDVLSSSQDEQRDQMQNNADSPEVTTGAAPDMTESIKPPICQIPSVVFEHTDQTGFGLGGESGISSMAVSPDLEDPGNEFGICPENVVLQIIAPHSEKQAEGRTNLFADDITLSVNNEDAAGLVLELHLPQQTHSEPTDRISDESFAANEDMFGHEVEDTYQRVLEQCMAQITADITSSTNEPKKQTDTKVTEVVKAKEKKEGAEKEEEEEDHEKTEISIMEATMDNNEWFTDGNYQVLPWMNLSVPSFAQNSTKTEPVSTEEHHHSSSSVDVTGTDTDIPLSAEARQTSTISPVDESTENNKKVVAVQPMPQNVNVTFRIHYLTHSPYQKVAITGDQEELGNWRDFIPLEKAKDGQWAAVVSLPAESHVEWKFVVVEKGEVCRWEECGNRLLNTGYGDDLVVHKWWGLL